jgi:pimeloyl-ACP methyl ester carboxylesterase
LVLASWLTAIEEVVVAENFVLVPGAWHGEWAGQPVAARLRAAGHNVLALTCPGLGVNDDPTGVRLADCVDHVVQAMEVSRIGDITLVGHSWGGFVIAGAAPRLGGQLKQLIFWSAFVPEAGRSLYHEVPPSYQQLFDAQAAASEDNTVALPAEVFQSAFMTDADPATAAIVHAVLRPQPFATFTDLPVNGEAYRELGVPLHYVLSVDDVALPPGEYGWDRFAERIKATPVRVPGSHESMFTHPGELANGILQAATG